MAFRSQKGGSCCSEAENENIIPFKNSSPKSHAYSNKSHFAYFIIIALSSKALRRETFPFCIESGGAFVHWEGGALCFQWENYTHATHCALKIKMKLEVVSKAFGEKLIWCSIKWMAYFC